MPDHFSCPGKAIGLACVCGHMSVQYFLYKVNSLTQAFGLIFHFDTIYTVSQKQCRLYSKSIQVKVQVTGENVAKTVGATSNGGLLVVNV